MANANLADVVEQLAPTGELRAAINLANELLVTDRAHDGEPIGVAPDMARAIADELGVPVRYVSYNKSSELADAVTKAYVEIEATYLVHASSDLQRLEDVDAPGRRITVTERTAYGLWLDRNIKQAELIHATDFESTFQQFVRQKLDALAGLRFRLVQDADRLAGSRVLDGRFTAVQQAIGTPIAHVRALDFLAGFVNRAKASGFVADLITKHGANGLSVAASD